MTLEERKEYTGLLREYSDRFERSEVNQVEEFVDGCGCRQVSDINGTCSGVRNARESGGESSGGVSTRCGWNIDVQ